MNSETDSSVPQIPCPRCQELVPMDSKFCSSCGADLYQQCPECGTARDVDSLFCKKCGFNFTRKKLRLRQETPVTDHPSETPLSRPMPGAAFRVSEKRSVYRMSPLIGAFRMVVIIGFLMIIAVGSFWILNWAWERIQWKDFAESLARLPSRISGRASVPPKPVEPDWPARYEYWYGYYMDIFRPMVTNTSAEVWLVSGVRERGILLSVTNHTVLLKKDTQEIGYPRLLLDNKTKQAFFPDEYAAVNAKAKVEAERADWKKQIEQQAAGSTNAPPPVAAPPALTFFEIRCPACSGQGFYFISVVDAKIGAKNNATVSRNEREGCPVCGGRGYRRFERAPEFPWPAGASRCKQCQGMGVVWSKMDQGTKKGVITTTPCRMCNHQGYLLNKWDADHKVPPKYD